MEHLIRLKMITLCKRAIIDTDEYDRSNESLLYPNKQEVDLTIQNPQIIPFKRDNWVHTLEYEKES